MTSKGRARSREFDMRPNLNPTQFSQGTLFSGGERTPASHRGYTPERMAEVRKTIRPYGTGLPAARAAATANVARSTIPMSDLKHPLQIHTGPSFFEPPYRDSSKDPADGYYDRYDGGRVHVMPKQAGTTTLIHELGHHKSHLEDTEHSKNYSYKTAAGGQEEAFADDYAAEHYRTPKGKPAPVGTYGGGSLSGRTPQFWVGYHANRQTGPDAEARRLERSGDAGSAVTLGLTAVKGQLPLLDKVTDGYNPPQSPPRWDYAIGDRRKDI